MTTELDVLAIGAHPDDIEICCGGTVAKLTGLGHKVGILDLTEGELGTGGDVPTRYAESKRASEILGLSARENLKLPDGGIDGNAPLETGSQLMRLIAAIRKYKPQLILAPYWLERHPDHVAASKLITRAVFFAGLKKIGDTEAHSPKNVSYFQMRVPFEASYVVDVSAVYEKKLAAIKAYASQFKASNKTLIASDQSFVAMEARDTLSGAQIGVSKGEAFLTLHSLAIEDPVKLFTTSSTSKGLFFPRWVQL
ncbi:bacillithiol biosynthesis deacetylase BshB1 [bacterium]|nr:bacillithiol biosynthesis deacetylase BshB1 [bacterium]